MTEWTYSPHRGRKHAPARDLSGDRFVVCIQNHDQVGNRAKGGPARRSSTRLRSGVSASSLLLLASHLPLLFMGEEYGEERAVPVLLLVQGEELIKAVREAAKPRVCRTRRRGRRGPSTPRRPPRSSRQKLTWSWKDGTGHAATRRLYADLLAALRKAWPAMKDYVERAVRVLPDTGNANVIEMTRGGKAMRCTSTSNVNSSPHPCRCPRRASLLFSSESTCHGGRRARQRIFRELLPFEAVVLGAKE